MPAINATAAAAAAAARRRQEEEEEMTPYAPGDVDQYEFKFIRSATGAFKNPAWLREFLTAEAEAGWELVELFDANRARLKRKLAWREKDAELSFDPYRTSVGMSEAKLMVLILLGVFGGLAALGGLVAILASRN